MNASLLRWKERVSPNSSLWADIFVLFFITMFLWSGFWFWQEGNRTFEAVTLVESNLSELPRYAFLSLTRSLIAFCISLVFAVAYGTLMVRNKKAESFLLPLLDILQSLPMLTFLPSIVLTLIQVFPSTRWGLEFSCILMLVTCQVWNLIFAYYESQKGIPREFVEIASLGKLTPWQKFRYLNLPNGLRPLVYNGMVSMAGGWFFLTLSESFEIANQRYQLPGLGSFLAITYKNQDFTAFSYGIGALVILIMGVDFILFRPLTVWVSKFSESESQDDARSLFVTLLQKAESFTHLQKRGKEVWESYFNHQKAEIFLERILGLLVFPFLKLFKLISIFIQFTSKLYKKYFGVLRFLFTLGLGALGFWLIPKSPQLLALLGKIDPQAWAQVLEGLIGTFLRVLGVLFLASLWTIPIGIWIGTNSRIASVLQPIIQNVAAFPVPVLYPLLAATFSSTSVPPWVICTFLMTIGNQWYLLFNVISGAMTIERDHKIVTSVYGLSLWQKFRFLYFPGILPSLVTGWFAAAGGAWNASIVAELIEFPGGKLEINGIGNIISKATSQGNFLLLGTAVVVFSFAIIILNRAVWSSLSKMSERRI